eukprot:CAMPEP_0171835758 /NCGR_PEP_ID=MMETSP0992-20121227/11173_1 /TAXON_ID=483369 /ORGANISM="non described non described, Strain CCMP2098" /LENGTH=581 /DNA_ID=CAMNT_0012451641 /DNA_START=47 /DNA_END=1792 /DNA_ORIENTATION=-
MMKAMFAKFSSGLSVGKSASKDLFDFMACFQLMGEKTPEGEAARKIGFRAADPNGNGLCSLAELETFVLSTLLAKYPKDAKTKVEKGKNLWELFRPSYIKAFTDAKDYKKDDGDVISGTKSATADDFVSKGEFRLFCAYLCIYASMYDAFSKIDGGGEGRGGDDRKIDMAEWMAKDAGYKGVKEHGFIGLASIKDAASAKLVFEAMDDNGGGVLMLDEWCDYLKKKEIEAGTKLGETLNEEEVGGAAAGGGGGGGAAAESGSSSKKGKAAQRPTKVYSSGLIVGADASKELFDFMDLFHPMAEKSPEAEKLREEGFVTADPNGNGLCSLAELETFVLKSLVTKFPKTGKGNAMMEPGKDLFDAFRPCYIRAFTDAKDYEKDTGEKIEGTKKATADDFVSKKEFRLFCAYLCVYAAMFDAFAKVDGGGAGRDASDDRRIDLAEMEKGYKGIGGFGFVAFKDLNTKADATAVFKSIDDNGGGIVLLDEWCLFIKNAEIKAGTTLGAILNEDEAGGVGKEYTLASAKGPSIKVGRVSASKGTPKALAKSKSRDISPGAKSTTSNKSKSSASSKKKGAADDGSKI